MGGTSTHSEVPAPACLGPDGAAAQVARALSLLSGRWTLAILFRLFAQPSVRYLALLRDIGGVTPKVLTDHLRGLEADGLVTRTDFDESPRRVEYSLAPDGEALRPVLVALRDFARSRSPSRPPGS